MRVASECCGEQSLTENCLLVTDLVRDGLNFDAARVPGCGFLRKVGPVHAQREEELEVSLVRLVAVEVRGGALAVGGAAVGAGLGGFGEAAVHGVGAADPSLKDSS